MLFSEIYGSYYNAVAEVLRQASEKNLTGGAIRDIVQKKAFGESLLTIPASLENGDWPLLTSDRQSVLQYPPTMPLTLLQKRWLKTLLQDPRIQLFSPSKDGLEDIEPLYDPKMIVYYDQYTDGDPYEDEAYIRRFQTILQAVREKQKLRIRFVGGKGLRRRHICIPLKLEYSPKDDKFRLLAVCDRKMLIINLARIRAVSVMEAWKEEELHGVGERKRELWIELTDERNALERVMLHFSDLEKETAKIDEKHYHIHLRYRREDETEILIRVLSFGPVLKVLAPESFIRQIQQRLERQEKISQKADFL